MTEPCGPECKWCGGRQRMAAAHPKTDLRTMGHLEYPVVRSPHVPIGWVYDMACPVQLGAEEE